MNAYLIRFRSLTKQWLIILISLFYLPRFQSIPSLMSGSVWKYSRRKKISWILKRLLLFYEKRLRNQSPYILSSCLLLLLYKYKSFKFITTKSLHLARVSWIAASDHSCSYRVSRRDKKQGGVLDQGQHRQSKSQSHIAPGYHIYRHTNRVYQTEACI